MLVFKKVITICIPNNTDQETKKNIQSTNINSRTVIVTISPTTMIVRSKPGDVDKIDKFLKTLLNQ